MLDHEEVTLFGAPPGQIVTFTLEVSHHDALTRIRVQGRAANRRDPFRLDIITEREHHDVPTILGRVIPVVVRTRSMRGDLMRRSLWAIHDWAGREGYDVTITGCGRAPTK